MYLPNQVNEEENRNRFARVVEVGEFVFAGVLTLYGVLGYYLVRDQLRAMHQQTLVMREQLADARRSAAEADRTIARQLALAESQTESLKSLATAYGRQLTLASEQADLLKRQLAVAESQATSLSSQASSLSSQAESVRREVDAITNQAESLQTIAEANRGMAAAAATSSEATRRVAETSIQQLEVTDRPWVRVAVSPTGPVEFLTLDRFNMVVPPVTTQDEGNRFGVGIRVEITLTNGGRSVANAVRVFSRVAFLSPRAMIGSDPLDEPALSACRAAETKSAGTTELFPGETESVYDSPFAEIAPDDTVPPSWFHARGTVEVVLIGCAVYTFRNSPGLHRTWFVYRVGKRTARRKAPFDTWSLEVGDNIPRESVLIQKWPFGGSGAD